MDGAGGLPTGLNRTGKSCRLRWVNYLHPGLKHGRMTPQEEQLVLELHAKWGNRWSRIARKLPGRTDNEIKNYWRTHMRKKVQEQKRMTSSPSLSSSSRNGFSTRSEAPSAEVEADKHECDSTGERGSMVTGIGEGEAAKGDSMEQLWNEISASDPGSELSFEEYAVSGCAIPFAPMSSPVWEFCSESLWRMDDDENKMLVPDPTNS